MNIILFEKDVRAFDQSDERYKHLKSVLHCDVGSVFKGGEINGQSGKCTILSFDDEGVTFSFEKEGDSSALYPLSVILAQVRPICMKRILRELVSLGVKRIILTQSELGEKSYISAGLYKSGEYKQILINGAMQAGFTGVSDVIFAKSVNEAISLVGESSTCLLLDNIVGSKSFSSLCLKNREVMIAIGPERGWSESEKNLFISAGFQSILLGHRVLRTETAAVSASALALQAMDYI